MVASQIDPRLDDPSEQSMIRIANRESVAGNLGSPIHREHHDGIWAMACIESRLFEGHTVRDLRPFFLRAWRTARPPGLFMRCRKPWTLLRCRLCG